MGDCPSPTTAHGCKVCGVRVYRKPGRGPWPQYCDEHRPSRVGPRDPFTAQLIEDHRKRGCLVCGISDPIFLLHLHHVDGRAKKANIALMRLWKPERVIVELAKTVPLCANHHAIVHHELRRDGAGMELSQLVDHVRGKYPGTLRQLSR